MSQILKAKLEQEKIKILNFNQMELLKYNSEDGNVICDSKGKAHSLGCLNCINPRCMKIEQIEVDSEKFKDISQDMNRMVCPVGAISMGKNSISLNESKCIGCGLCVSRCPAGALYLKDGKAKIQIGNPKEMIELNISKENKDRQTEQIKCLLNLKRDGRICLENDNTIKAIHNSILKMSQEEQNILARNLLIVLGNKATLTRKGNVYTRMDGFVHTSKSFGVVEVETGSDMLDVSRALLDDIAVINVRYNIPARDNHPLAIVLGLPNKRTDYWQVLKDIKNVLGIKISTVTFESLLLLIWNLKKVDEFDRFYIDVDNSSIRKEIEQIIGRKMKMSIGIEGSLENSK